MTATRDDVNRWIDTAKSKGCKFIISVCDTFDWDDFPVYIKDLNELILKVDNYNGTNMQTINEIIRINDDGTVTENLTVYNATK
jgi:hypothetical protein